MKRISQRLLLDFTANLSLLLKAGLPLPEAVLMIGEYSRDRKIRELCGTLSEGLNRGRSFTALVNSGALPFPPLYRGLIGIGERVGSLNGILPALTAYLEQQKKVRNTMVNASLYPLMVLSLSLLGIIFLVIFILPRMEEFFSGIMQSGEELALLERDLSLFSGVLIAVLIIAGVILLLFILGRHHENLQARIEGIILKLPGLRRIMIDPDLYSFTFAVELLTSRGVALSTALPQAAPVCRSLLFRRAILAVHMDLTSGSNLFRALDRCKIFPDRVVRWAGIGEQTGKTDQVFGQLRIFYEQEIEKGVSRLMGIIEPLLIILVGVFIIALILTFVVPLISIFGTVL